MKAPDSDEGEWMEWMMGREHMPCPDQMRLSGVFQACGGTWTRRESDGHAIGMQGGDRRQLIEWRWVISSHPRDADAMTNSREKYLYVEKPDFFGCL